ncbi:MAG: hypothetical protein Kow0079_14290 [Vicingaceae bacterium]
MDSLVLITRNNCCCCKKVAAHLEAKKIPVKMVNIDEEDYQSPINVMIFPALLKVKNEIKLLAYGDDILRYLQKF